MDIGKIISSFASRAYSKASKAVDEVKEEVLGDGAISGPYANRVGEASSFNVNFGFIGKTLRNFEWDFGDGTTAKGPEAQHIYSKPGRYMVTFTGENVITGRKAKLAYPIDIY